MSVSSQQKQKNILQKIKHLEEKGQKIIHQLDADPFLYSFFTRFKNRPDATPSEIEAFDFVIAEKIDRNELGQGASNMSTINIDDFLDAIYGYHFTPYIKTFYSLLRQNDRRTYRNKIGNSILIILLRDIVIGFYKAASLKTKNQYIDMFIFLMRSTKWLHGNPNYDNNRPLLNIIMDTRTLFETDNQNKSPPHIFFKQVIKKISPEELLELIKRSDYLYKNIHLPDVHIHVGHICKSNKQLIDFNTNIMKQYVQMFSQPIKKRLQKDSLGSTNVPYKKRRVSSSVAKKQQQQKQQKQK